MTRQGNLKNWWTPEDLKNFKERGDCIAQQFQAFELDGLHENGKLVEGESIADLGGLTISYAAFEKTLQGKNRPALIDGFTPEQRFFLGFAQVWAGNYRPEFARLMIKTNAHPARAIPHQRRRFRTCPRSQRPLVAARVRRWCARMVCAAGSGEQALTGRLSGSSLSHCGTLCTA